MVSCKAIISKTARNNFSILLKYANTKNPVHQTIFNAEPEVQEEAAHMLRNSISGLGSRTLICYDFKVERFIESAFVNVTTYNVAYTGASEISEMEVIWCINRLLLGITSQDIQGKLIVEADGETIETWDFKPNTHIYKLDDFGELDRIAKYMKQM